MNRNLKKIAYIVESAEKNVTEKEILAVIN